MGAVAYKLAVIGHPISQSKSPFIHNSWLRDCGLQGDYCAIDIAPDDFTAGIMRLVQDGFHGWNVTIPHKENMFAACQQVTPMAQSIGAVNTVKVQTDGSLLGTNTDADGWWLSVENAMPALPKRALVLGAGGAARAILYALASRSIPTLIANRTAARAEVLAAQFGAQVIAWDEITTHLPGTDLLVNTTSLGMDGQPPLLLDIAGLPPEALVSDLIYKPRQTALLAQAQTLGLVGVNGLGMLLEQARLAFQLWTGHDPVISDELRAALEG